jgi:hypothetical protein
VQAHFGRNLYGECQMNPEQLEHAIQSGAQQVVTCLAAASEGERRTAAPLMLKWHKELWSDVLAKDTRGISRQLLMDTLPLALLGTATSGELKASKLLLFAGPFEDEIQVLRRRNPSWLQDWAEWYIQDSPYHWLFIRALEKAKLIARPHSDFYILGMVCIADRYQVGTRRMGALGFLNQEPELLTLVPRLFEVEGSGEFSLAAFDKYRGAEHQWGTALKTLSQQGRLDRQMLLERSLDALARDFAAFRAGWYARFYESLEPTLAEQLSLLGRIFALLGSPIAATVSFAVKILTVVAKKHKLPADQLLQHLEPVWMLPQKGTVLAALKLLANTPKSPGWLPQLTLAASHPLAEVQSEALRLLKLAAPIPPTEWLLRWTELLPSLEPSVQAGWSEWLGCEIAEVPVELVVAVCGPQAVLPCRDLDHLFEIATRLLEDPASPLEIEQLLEGLFRFNGQDSPLAPAFRKRVKARLKSLDFRRTLAVLLSTWLGEPQDLAHPQLPKPEGFLNGRLLEILRALKTGNSRILSLPSYSDGSISVKALADRLRHKPVPLPYDFAQALLRVDPASLDWSLADLEGINGEAGLALKFALRVDGGKLAKSSLWSQAIDLLHQEPAPKLCFDFEVKVSQHEYSGKTYTHRHFEIFSKQENAFIRWRDHEHEPQLLRWLAFTCPTRSERFHALGISRLANNLDWWEANWSERVYLESLLDLARPWSYTTAFLAALGLACKETGERGVSIDAVGAALGGALLPELLGQAMAQAESTGMITHKRWASSFQEMRRFVNGGLLFEALQSYLAKAAPNSDSGVLLGPMLEISTSLGRPVTDPLARHYLAGFSGTGKSAKLAQQLLAK